MRNYTNSQITALIDEHIHNIKHRRILKLRFVDGLTYEKIAEDAEVDLTPRRVASIVSKEAVKLDMLLG